MKKKKKCVNLFTYINIYTFCNVVYKKKICNKRNKKSHNDDNNNNHNNNNNSSHSFGSFSCLLVDIKMFFLYINTNTNRKRKIRKQYFPLYLHFIKAFNSEQLYKYFFICCFICFLFFFILFR